MRAPDFWAADGVPARLLAPLSHLFDLAGRLRRGLTTPGRVGVPVVCVGNLVAGGAGKTPVALALAEILTARGLAVHLLTRGYGGRLPGPVRVDPDAQSFSEVGDEALLLARRAPAWVARDRVAGARAAEAGGAEVLVLDDGFQNPSLAKDLSLLVVDGTYGLGNGRVMPAGPLREAPDRALARADAVVLIGEDRAGSAAWLGPRRPLLRAELAPAPDAPDLTGVRVLAFAGIGRPEKVFASLEAAGAELVERRAFPDHHPYTRAELDALLDRATALDARPVTTEKDAVRLPDDLRSAVTVLPVVLRWSDPAAVANLLDGLPVHGES